MTTDRLWLIKKSFRFFAYSLELKADSLEFQRQIRFTHV